MMKIILGVWAIVAGLVVEHSALGQCSSCPNANDYTVYTNTSGRVCIRQFGGANIPNATSGSATINSTTGRYDIFINLAHGPTAFYSGNPIVDINGDSSFVLGRITVKNVTTLPAQVIIRGCSTGAKTASIGQVIKDSTSTSEVWLVECRLTGDIGYDAQSGQSGIQVDTFNTGVIDGSISNGIKILKGGLNIANVTVGGNIVGNVSLAKDSSGSSFINSLIVTGTIGGASGTIGAITAPGGINLLQAASINATISTTTSGGIGNVHRISLTSSSTPYASTMDLYSVSQQSGQSNPGIVLAGHLTGSINIRNGLASSNYVQLPTAGLEGQINVNTANNATPSSFWGGYVQVDGIKLSPNSAVATTGNDIGPYYARTASDLGGGAVGLAPFHLYSTDCSPIDRDLAIGATHGVSEHLWEDSGHQFGGTPPVKIRFYGPIAKNIVANWHNSANLYTSAIKIECKPEMVSDCTWVPAGDMFKVVGPGDAGSTSQRGLEIYRKNTGTRVGPGLYRVVFQRFDDGNGNPVRSVVCAGVDGTPEVVAPNDCLSSNDLFTPIGYEFRVWADCDLDGRDDAEFAPDPTHNGCNTGCRADFDRSGAVAVMDIFRFLEGWFAGTCVAGTFPPTHPTTSMSAPCYGTSTDYDHSGTLSVGDIFSFLSDWFAASCQ